MSWVTIIWSMTASACLTLAAVQLLVWFRLRTAWAYLLFFLITVANSLLAFSELRMLHAETPGEFGAALRWANIPGCAIFILFVGFVRVYLQAGRLWLAWVACILRIFALLLNFLVGQNLDYREVTSLHRIRFLGEFVAASAGVPNSWMLVGQLSLLLLAVFIADASITVWRRGDRRRAVMIGGSMLFFVVAGTLQAILVYWQIVHWPTTPSLFFMPVIAAMGYETSRDLLRAARLSEELRESEERMILATEAAQLGVWIRDLAQNEIWASDGWREMFGFTKTERLDLDRFHQRLHPEDREMVQRSIARAVETGGHYEKEYRVILPGGQTHWITSRGRVELNGSGRPVLIRGVTLDITRRKEAELEVARQRNEVAHLSRVTTLGEISGSLAHELTQPLGAILTNAEAAERHLRSEAPNLAELRNILADIRRDDLHAGEIIHGMRAFLRRRDLELQPLDLNQFIHNAVQLLGADVAARNVTIGLEIPSTLPRVLGDHIHLQQVLVNLVVNAMDAMNTCPLPMRRILIRAASRPPDMVEVAVSDAGVGIPPADVSRVFDPFHTTKPSGVGLGLSICRSIVEAHGGAISIENNLDRGATARFTMPVCCEEPTP